MISSPALRALKADRFRNDCPCLLPPKHQCPTPGLFDCLRMSPVPRSALSPILGIAQRSRNAGPLLFTSDIRFHVSRTLHDHGEHP